MSTEPTLKQAIELLVLEARVRVLDMERLWRDGRGRWEDPRFESEHGKLAQAITKVEGHLLEIKEQGQ